MNHIICVSGEPVSGKSTTIREVKRKLEEKNQKVTVLSVGEIFKELARKEGINIEKFNQEMMKRPDIDRLIDRKTKEFGERFEKRNKENEILIVDARLGWHELPDAFSVRLTANEKVAGERAYQRDPDHYQSVEEATRKTAERKRGEVIRYKQRYQVDLEKEENYNLIVDTSYATTQDISDVILQCFEADRANQFYTKKWTSPKTLLPLQDIRETAYNADIIENSIKEKGYIPSEAIEVIEVDGVKAIIEGHHRNFSAARVGKTLVPYEVLAKDDETLKGYGKSTARERMESLKTYELMDHECLFDKDGKKFSYTDIYPHIYEPNFLENLKKKPQQELAMER